MNPQDASVIWSVVSTVLSTAMMLITWSFKKHWSDLEKRVEKNEAGERMVLQRLSEIAIHQARGESIADAVEDLKLEVRKMRADLYRVGITHRPPNESNS